MTCTSLLMCTPADLKVKANWDGAAGQSRHLLLSQLSSKIFINDIGYSVILTLS